MTSQEISEYWKCLECSTVNHSSDDVCMFCQTQVEVGAALMTWDEFQYECKQLKGKWTAGYNKLVKE